MREASLESLLSLIPHSRLLSFSVVCYGRGRRRGFRSRYVLFDLCRCFGVLYANRFCHAMRRKHSSQERQKRHPLVRTYNTASQTKLSPCVTSDVPHTLTHTPWTLYSHPRNRNLLDSAGGGLAFWAVGYAFAYGGDDASKGFTFVGNTGTTTRLIFPNRFFSRTFLAFTHSLLLFLFRLQISSSPRLVGLRWRVGSSNLPLLVHCLPLWLGPLPNVLK